MDRPPPAEGKSACPRKRGHGTRLTQANDYAYFYEDDIPPECLEGSRRHEPIRPKAIKQVLAIGGHGCARYYRAEGGEVVVERQ